MKATNLDRRRVEWWERCQLESQGCRSTDWTRVLINDATSLSAIRNVSFEGDISIGILRHELGNGIENARLRNVKLGDYVSVRNVGLLEFEEDSQCGMGSEVSVLDESGARSVRIYPGLSAQIALLMARLPKWRKNYLEPILAEHIENIPVSHSVGKHAVIENCAEIINVYIDKDVHVIGASHLRNGMVINNASRGRCVAGVGAGVDAENFIIEDGYAGAGAIIRNCYIGQGAIVEKGFSAHDSLIFANCHFENGEACALFGGPFTVSMHKSSLLIGCQTSFMNAGSGTNQSNHMYKLGPVHWGILERGVKTSSDSYLMLGAKIGAFSLLMGQHKTHPDSSQFPFSYLFGDDRGATVVVPAVMLRSCGLLRDEKKWPARDRRVKRKLPLHDRIIYDVLNPVTVEKILSAYQVIDELLIRPTDDDRYLRYKGMKFTRASLERARHLYELAIFKYLHTRLEKSEWPEKKEESTSDDWVDIVGLPMTRRLLKKATDAVSISDMENVFDDAYTNFRNYEMEWIGNKFDARWRKPAEVIAAYAEEFDRMAEEDRARYLEELAAQNDMLAL